MPRCSHSGPCGCGQGQAPRLMEPVLLCLIAQKGQSYGYDLAAELPRYAPAASADRTVLYRWLRQLEAQGHLESEWELPDSGPARRVYRVTGRGRVHLAEWLGPLEQLAGSLDRLLSEARGLLSRDLLLEETIEK
jgi:PadR family transcriptional regulator, regulatory protein PadR